MHATSGGSSSGFSSVQQMTMCAPVNSTMGDCSVDGSYLMYMSFVYRKRELQGLTKTKMTISLPGTHHLSEMGLALPLAPPDV